MTIPWPWAYLCAWCRSETFELSQNLSMHQISLYLRFPVLLPSNRLTTSNTRLLKTRLCILHSIYTHFSQKEKQHPFFQVCSNKQAWYWEIQVEFDFLPSCYNVTTEFRDIRLVLAIKHMNASESYPLASRPWRGHVRWALGNSFWRATLNSSPRPPSGKAGGVIPPCYPAEGR